MRHRRGVVNAMAQKYQKFHFFVKSHLAGANPLTDFLNF